MIAASILKIAISSGGMLLLVGFGTYAVITAESSSPSTEGGTAGDRITAEVQSTAEAAITAWQTLFVEEPQSGVSRPAQAKLASSSMSVSAAESFVVDSSTSAAQLFEGAPLTTLTRSLASEVKTAAPVESLAAHVRNAHSRTAAGSANQTSSSGGYTICVAAGARSFDFSRISVSGATATADLTAYAWTTNVDHFADGHSQLDTAQGTEQYHLEMSQSPDGDWLVDGFTVNPEVDASS